jgi:hypothetical protein
MGFVYVIAGVIFLAHAKLRRRCGSEEFCRSADCGCEGEEEEEAEEEEEEEAEEERGALRGGMWQEWD